MRTHVKVAGEETGQAPACTGALLEIKSIKRAAVKKADSEYVGCAQYVVQLQIKTPKGAAGMTVFDRIRVGTPDDVEAQKKATWEVSEGGPARLTRLLKRAGVAMADDDEEWTADAVGRTVVAPITKRGEYTNVGLYYRETDKDCPVIGLADGASGKAAGPRKTRPVEADEPEEADEPAKPAVDEEDEPAPVKATKPAKKGPPDDPVDDEDDDEPAAKPAKVAPKKAAKPAPPDDDDDD